MRAHARHTIGGLAVLLLIVLAPQDATGQLLSIDRCASSPISLKACASLRVQTDPLPGDRTAVTIQVRSWEGTDVRFAQEHWVGVTNLTLTGESGELGSVDMSTFQVSPLGDRTVPTTAACKDPACHDIDLPSWRVI